MKDLDFLSDYFFWLSFTTRTSWGVGTLRHMIIPSYFLKRHCCLYIFSKYLSDQYTLEVFLGNTFAMFVSLPWRVKYHILEYLFAPFSYCCFVADRVSLKTKVISPLLNMCHIFHIQIPWISRCHFSWCIDVLTSRPSRTSVFRKYSAVTAVGQASNSIIVFSQESCHAPPVLTNMLTIRLSGLLWR